jgi:hypothetical protein
MTVQRQAVPLVQQYRLFRPNYSNTRTTIEPEKKKPQRSQTVSRSLENARFGGLKAVCLRFQVFLRNVQDHSAYGIVHLRQQCHNSKRVVFQERLLKILKCYNFLCVQLRHNCSPAASFANCVTTLHLLKVHLQTFLSTPITQKCQILNCDSCRK